MRLYDKAPCSALPAPNMLMMLHYSLAFQSQQRRTADMKDDLNGINVNEHLLSQILNVLCMELVLGHMWDKYKYH